MAGYEKNGSGEVMKDCVIIAAGYGSRLNGSVCPKPLIKIQNKYLVEYVIDAAISCGIQRFFVVTGFEQAHVSKVLDEISQQKNIDLKCLYNPHWQQANGLSVLAAREQVQAPFVLTMADHIFKPDMLRQLLLTPPSGRETLLGVDGAISNNPNIDLQDVTRVLVADQHIVHIGKLIPKYNAFDTGLFYCSSYLFDAIERANKTGESSLSAAINILREEKLARVRWLQRCQWIDVDTPQMLEKANQLILQGIL